jgi:hypothetical protein
MREARKAEKTTYTRVQQCVDVIVSLFELLFLSLILPFSFMRCLSASASLLRRTINNTSLPEKEFYALDQSPIVSSSLWSSLSNTGCLRLTSFRAWTFYPTPELHGPIDAVSACPIGLVEINSLTQYYRKSNQTSTVTPHLIDFSNR